MRKRSGSHLPVVYANSKPIVSVTEGYRIRPIDLKIFDVTYLHFHQYLELGLCISGRGICQVEEDIYPFSEGDVEIIFPYQRHLSKNVENTPSIWYWVNIDVSEVLSRAGFSRQEQLQYWMYSEMGICGIIDKNQYGDICRSVKNIFRLLRAGEEEYLHPQEMLANELMGLILKLCEISRNLPKLSLNNKSFASDLIPALARISEEIQNGNIPKVTELPVLCSMSPANFRRIFYKTLGFTPKEYISRCCIHKAKKLLASSDMSVAQIAAEIGYENISGFNRCFLRLTQMSPSQFRQMIYESTNTSESFFHDIGE